MVGIKVEQKSRKEKSMGRYNDCEDEVDEAISCALLRCEVRTGNGRRNRDQERI